MLKRKRKMEDSNIPNVVVLVLTYNGKNLLYECLSSYLQNDYKNFEIVVIDNGSSDGTETYVRKKFPKVSLLRLEENRGYSGGFNFGLNYAVSEKKADYVLVTNNDVKVDKLLISELVNVAEKDEMIGFVTGKVYFYDVNGQKNILQTIGRHSDPIKLLGSHIGGHEEDKGQYEEVSERDFVDDVFTLVRAKVIEKTGGFDETFFLQHEESDWQLRSRKIGYKIFYTPHAKLWHKVGMSTGGPDSALRHFNNKRNHLLLVKRHGNVKQFSSFLFFRVFWELPIWFVLYSIKRRPDLIMAILKGTLSAFAWILKYDKV